MEALLKSTDAALWQTALDGYDEAVSNLSKTGKRKASLISLDNDVRKQLPKTVETRKSEIAPQGYLTKEDFCKIVEWKITRGKFRPLMRFANALTPKESEISSQEALQLARTDIPGAMAVLTRLKGIGPATASAILSMAESSGQCPFLSDEAMQAFGIVNRSGKLDYTIASWETLRKACKAKAAELNDKGERGDQDEQESEWTPVLVERAIWAASMNKQEK